MLVLLAYPVASWGQGEERAPQGGASQDMAPESQPIETDPTLPGDVVPPRLLSAVRPHYPEAELAEGRSPSVVLELTIDQTGHVMEAQVHKSAGPAFDAAALDAGLKLEFSPALQGGHAVVAKILYELRFVAPAGSPLADAVAALPAARPTRAPPEPPAQGSRRSPVQEVVVRGLSQQEELRKSALAVDVVDLERDKRGSADLGEVLVRSTNLGVQRSGGLGSSARYSLNGLSGDRVRFFMDGIPLELAGYPMGLANVPVNLIERVEIYQGVVPVRFGADALGGAVNLVTDQSARSSRAGASYQFGSFDTHRLTLGGRHFFSSSKTFVRGSAFFDSSTNDYPIDVEVAGESGALEAARVRRFHDGYTGAGGTLSFGLVDRPLADRLMLSAFASVYERDVQHNVAMTVPYGEVTYARQSAGTTATYAHQISSESRVDAVFGYTYGRTHFEDLSRCRYDWYGRCAVELPLPGEIIAVPADRYLGEHTAFLRSSVSMAPFPEHNLRVAFAPTVTRRRGHDDAIADGAYDPLTAERNLSNAVLGLEYELLPEALSLDNVAFVKAYGALASSDELTQAGRPVEIEEERLLFGAGDGLSIELRERVYLKASYEYAARLPNADELFGDGGITVANLELLPERSHNLNLGLVVDDVGTDVGSLRARLGLAARRATDLILLLNSGNYYQYSNVLSARAYAVDAALGLSLPGDWFGADASVGYQDVRNVSSSGPTARFRSDRIPNLPYLEFGGSAYLRRDGVTSSSDSVELTWTLRHVSRFLRGWESAGTSAVKLDVPSQTVQSLGLSYLQRGSTLALGASVEVQNVTDERVFDLYGVQRPGRAFYFKTTLEQR
jgi:vitamin B12 transporter